MNAAFPAASPHRDAWSRTLPLLVALVALWLCARGLKKSFWTLLAMYWAVRWMW